jgi:hypothetical protein
VSQSNPLLGQLPSSEDRRDAIHIAIVPVVAACDMRPATPVTRLSSGSFGPGEFGPPEDGAKPIGIVDPFLAADVKKGELFWLCLYPYTITSLRHVWTHPEFKPRIG